MRKIKNVWVLFLVSFLLAFCWVAAVSAAPILNEYAPGAYYDTFPDTGESFGYFTNSGDWMFTEAGNSQGSAETLAWVEGLVRDYFNFGVDFFLEMSATQFDVYDNNTGTWAVVPPAEGISFYAVKAGNAFAMYNVDPAQATGSWSTYDIWLSGLQGTGGNDGLEISHFTGYNATPAPIPEPATLLLLGTGLVGFVGFNRKKRRRG